MDIETPALVVASLVIVALTYLLLREQRKTNRLRANEVVMEARKADAISNPTVKCVFENLPPYTEEHPLTKLTIHNGGNCSLVEPKTSVRCSWAPHVTMLLDWLPDTNFVANEDKIFEFGLSEPPRGNHIIRVRTDGVHPIIQEGVYFVHEEKLTI